jgi:pimeloyl-ACP methyl ester carboxylesterase
MHDWSLQGSDDEPIRGSVDHPAQSPKAVVLFAHGFKGYKDYGFIPVLGRAMARAGAVVHRFNFSHSGMGEGIETFERPDLFERDTWNRQVFDLQCVAQAAAAGDLPDTPVGLPIVLVGHSRGGVSCLLAAARAFRDGREPLPDGVFTMSAPSATCSLAEGDRRVLLADGRLRSPSARTGQDLYVGRPWLKEQIDEPEDHDVLELCGYITCPVMAVHGAADPTVPSRSADEIARACPDASAAVVADGDHVFSTPNPADPDAEPSPPLAALIRHAETFLGAL